MSSRSSGLTARGRLLLLSPALLVIAVFFVGGVAEGLAQSLGHQPLLGESDWSFDAYRSAAADPAVRAGLGLTLRIGVLAMLISTALGLAIALVVRRLAAGRAWMTRLLEGVVATPHLVGALCIGVLLSPSGLVSRVTNAIGLTDGTQGFPVLTQDSFGAGIIAEYVWKETPFMAIIALAALGPQVSALERAARSLGASSGQRLRHVTVPTVAPPVLAGSLLVLAFTMGSYEVPRLLGQPYPAALPVVAYQSFTDTDLSARPEAIAVAMLIAVLTLATAIAYAWLVTKVVRR